MSENQDHLGGDELPDEFDDEDPVTDVTPKYEGEGNEGTDYFKSYASSLFPDAKWTGGSDIHASIARNADLPLEYNPENVNKVLKAAVDTGFYGYLQRVINKHCPGMEWIISPDDFENLLLLDMHRLAHGLPTTETKARLQNPATGNYFHRITLLEDKNIVGGIRVWLEPGGYGGSSIRVGFRFRLERIIPEGTETMEDAAARIRVRTSQQVLEEASEAEALKENLKETVTEGEQIMIEQYVEVKDF